MPHPLPLLQLSPCLAPSAGLLRGPTPVQPLAGGAWLKRDDLSAADYGGNKIRKLDFLLADAHARGVRTLLGFGYAGSNFVAAMAWHGRALGLDTLAFLLPQVPAAYAADNLSVALHAGARLHACDSTAAAGTGAILASAGELLRRGRLPMWVPPGGSSPLGVLGFINAALELRAQVAHGELPEPATIHIAFSSMGSVAGLALGLELAGLRSRIQAVQVVDERFASPDKLRSLLQDTRHWLARRDAALHPDAERALARVSIRREFFGRAYGEPTAQTRAAMARFTEATGARADSAYSGKALACFYRDLDAGQAGAGPALFWHTFNAHGLPAGVVRPAPETLPAGLRPYFAPAA